jgi:hypothetical protein
MAVVTDAEMIFWTVALIVTILFVAGLLIVGEKIWGN